jgi:hypothetical protein
MKHYLIGSLTALKNTAIAMTVTDVYEYTPAEGSDDEETTTITAMYFAGDILQTVQLDADQFIGFGDYLIFENGHFTDAAFHETDDDDDDDTGPTDEPEA